MTKNPESLPFDNSPYILALYKPKGLSSFDCIRALKKVLFDILGRGKGRRKLKIGHFGTLDPFAEGVLLIGTGKALKLMKFFQEGMSKSYIALGSLDFSTDTGDCEGELLRYSDPDHKGGPFNLEETILSFTGEYHQRPPYFSAVKHQGRPLYEWAREGVFITKDPVRREVYSCQYLEEVSGEEKGIAHHRFRCEVSSGTYIRGLWSDIAQKLGLEGHLITLKRISWGGIHASDCLALPFLTEGALDLDLGRDRDVVKEALKRPYELWKLPQVKLGEGNAAKFRQGQFLFLDSDGALDGAERLPSLWKRYGWVFSEGENFLLLGLGELIDQGGQRYLKVSVNLVN